MQHNLRNRHAIVACLLLSPFAAFAADIQINGSCIQGTCTSSGDALTVGQSNASPGTTPSPYSLVVNGDTYSVSWVYADSFPSGTKIFIDPTVTFVSGPSTTADTVNFDFFQNYSTDIPSPTFDGPFTETVPLTIAGNVGASSSASGELFYYTTGAPQGLGLVTQTGVGSTDVTNSATLSGLDGSTETAEYEFTYVFAAGTTSGTISSPGVPEPGETLPLALAVLGACAFTLRRRAKFGKI